MVRLTVLEYDGEGDFGQHWFLQAPRTGETIEGLDGKLYKVVEVRHILDNSVPDIMIFVQRNP